MFVSLPYLTDHNVALGLVCKHYLERVVEGQTPLEALTSTEKAFPPCVSVKGDLEKGFRFWKQLIVATESLIKEDSITSATFDMFKDANAWLEKIKF